MRIDRSVVAQLQIDLQALPFDREVVLGFVGAFVALCLGLRGRAVARIHSGGETRLGDGAAQPSNPAFVEPRSRHNAP